MHEDTSTSNIDAFVMTLIYDSMRDKNRLLHPFQIDKPRPTRLGNHTK